MIQLHLCLVYLASGLMKASGDPWWDGDAVWRSLLLPEHRQYDFCGLADHPWFARLSGWMVIGVETGSSRGRGVRRSTWRERQWPRAGAEGAGDVARAKECRDHDAREVRGSLG